MKALMLTYYYYSVECCRHIGQEEGLKQDEGIRMEVGVWSIVWWQWI